MRKYFRETLLREDEFRKILGKFLETEDIFEQANNHIINGNLIAAIEKFVYEIEKEGCKNFTLFKFSF